MKLKKIICFLFGHDADYDGHCEACNRCGKHSYYDDDYFNEAVLIRPFYYLKRKYREIRSYIDKLKNGSDLPF